MAQNRRPLNCHPTNRTRFLLPPPPDEQNISSSFLSYSSSSQSHLFHLVPQIGLCSLSPRKQTIDRQEARVASWRRPVIRGQARRPSATAWRNAWQCDPAFLPRRSPRHPHFLTPMKLYLPISLVLSCWSVARLALTLRLFSCIGMRRLPLRRTLRRPCPSTRLPLSWACLALPVQRVPRYGTPSCGISRFGSTWSI